MPSTGLNLNAVLSQTCIAIEFWLLAETGLRHEELVGRLAEDVEGPGGRQTPRPYPFLPLLSAGYPSWPGN